MKTNKTRKVLIALLAVISIFTFAASAFAQTEAVSTEETSAQAETTEKPAAPAEKQGKKDGKHRHGNPKKDADWFEDRIEAIIDAHEGRVDFSQLPDNPTDEELMEFFTKNFTGEGSGQKTGWKKDCDFNKDGKSTRENKPADRSDSGKQPPAGEEKRPTRPMKHHDDDDSYDRLEDWFEYRIDVRKHSVDFSQLPENPTDEEIVEFFKKNFMGEKSK